jgi:hypothetical protein
MSEPYSAGRRLQAGILSTVRRSQEITVGVIQISVQSITPILPKVNAPFAGKLPRPEAFVAGTYDFAEQLLASQRKFTEDVVQAAKPLLLWGGPPPGPEFDDDDDE